MSKLNFQAREKLRSVGISQAAWARRWSADGRWHGDVCGCPDDRCVHHHHNAGESCRCLEALLADVEVPS